MKRTVFVVLALLISAVGAAPARAEVPADVAALLHKKCAVCHKGKTPPRGLSWEAGRIAEAVDRPSVEAPGFKLIDTASPTASYTLMKVRRGDDIKGKPMPPLQALTPAEIELLEGWIAGLKKTPAPVSAAGRPVGPATSRPGRR